MKFFRFGKKEKEEKKGKNAKPETSSALKREGLFNRKRENK